MPPAGIPIINIILESFRNLLEFHFLPQSPSCPWLVDRGTFGSGSWRVLLRLRCALTSPLLMGACSTTKPLLQYPSESASVHSLLRFLHSLAFGGQQAWLTGWQLADRHKSETPCNRTGLRSLGGQGAVRAWGSYTKPIPRGFPCPAAC